MDFFDDHLSDSFANEDVSAPSSSRPKEGSRRFFFNLRGFRLIRHFLPGDPRQKSKTRSNSPLRRGASSSSSLLCPLVLLISRFR